MKLKNLAGALCLGTLLAASAWPAAAEFPERRIQVSFPWQPGAPAYVVSQLVADGMAEILGVDVAVVAKPGAGGVNAIMAGLAEPADGYTIIDGYVAPVVISPMFDKADFNYKDFIPLHSGTSNAFAIAVRADEDRFTDFPSFIQYMKDHPGETRFSASEELTLPFMINARMMQSQGVVARNVPYVGMAPAIKDLRGGLLDWALVNPGVYRANKDHIRLLAVYTDRDEVVEIYDGAPKLESFDIDTGVTGLSQVGWDWWLVQDGTPDEAVEKLRDAMARSLENPEVRAKIAEMGFVPIDEPADRYYEIAAQVEADLKSAIESVTWLREEIAKLN